MTAQDKQIISRDPWQNLKEFTSARIALGRCGVSTPTAEVLRFRAAHAAARDAVYSKLDTAKLAEAIAPFPTMQLQSAAESRSEYLTRPDKGRMLSERSRAELQQRSTKPASICFVVADGLSSPAIAQNATPFLTGIFPILTKAGFSIAPTAIVTNGRVAIGDEIAKLLQAEMVVVCIGERPGLLSPDSMGLYLTYRKGIASEAKTTDADRNCISNVRPEGMSVSDAIIKAAYLIENAFLQKVSGVGLKDRMTAEYLPFTERKRVMA